MLFFLLNFIDKVADDTHCSITFISLTIHNITERLSFLTSYSHDKKLLQFVD